MQPLTKEIDGVLHVSPAALLLMAADAACLDKHANGVSVVREVLAAARVAGYAQTEIVETLLTRAPSRRRTQAAQELCAHLSIEAFANAIHRAGFND